MNVIHIWVYDYNEHLLDTCDFANLDEFVEYLEVQDMKEVRLIVDM